MYTDVLCTWLWYYYELNRLFVKNCFKQSERSNALHHADCILSHVQLSFPNESKDHPLVVHQFPRIYLNSPPPPPRGLTTF